MLHRMSSELLAPQVAQAAKVSSGVDEKRWNLSRSISTITSACVNARSTSPHSKSEPQVLLVPAVSCSRTLSSSDATASITGGSGSYSTLINSTASAAIAGEIATTAATGSP